jgi:hypothetical protein
MLSATEFCLEMGRREKEGGLRNARLELCCTSPLLDTLLIGGIGVEQAGEEALVVDAEVCALLQSLSCFLSNMLDLNWVCRSANSEVTITYDDPPRLLRRFLMMAISAVLDLGR